MNQTDIFSSNKEDFLYGEISKMRASFEKELFILRMFVQEIQDEMLQMKVSYDALENLSS